MAAASRGRGMTAAVAAVAAAAAIAGCAATGPRPAPRAEAEGACSDRTPAPCEADCYRGNGAACAIVGEALNGMADAPVRLPQDLPRGRKALDKGCQLGNLDACRSLVDIDSESTPPGTACAGWEAVCKRGNRRACSFFAQCLDHDDHFRQDRAEALRLFREGCDAGERVACRELGFHVFEGDGVPKDLVAGLALLARACSMDDQAACAHEGLRLEMGQGAPRDLERAKARYRTACARGIRPIPCEGLRRLGEEPPSTVAAPSADARESIHVSARFGWEWRLPANWQFVAASAVPLTDGPAGAEVIVARPRDPGARESLSFVVDDYAQDRSATYDEAHKTALNAAEHDATAWLAEHGIAPSASTRGRFWGNDAVRIEARTAPPDSRVLIVTSFCKFEKRFEMRCLSPKSDPNVPCLDALGALMFHEPKVDPRNFPRVLHLRDDRTGVSFDAPDDSWLATGPHPGGDEVHWTWIYQHRFIVVTVGQLDTPADEVFDLMTHLWGGIPRKGANVTRQQSTLGGRPCTHVVVDEKDREPKDVFIQRRGGYVYLLSIEAPTRDPALVEQARAGLRVDETPR